MSRVRVPFPAPTFKIFDAAASLSGKWRRLFFSCGSLTTGTSPLALGFAITFGCYLWFIASPYFETFTAWTSSHGAILFLSLVAFKTAGMVWPPIPGGILTFGAIPIIGWPRAYVADLLGSMTGSTVAYWLARRWGIRFVSHILDSDTVAAIARVRIPERRQLEAVYLFRVLGSGTVIEVVCYAAGLLRVRYHHFLAASILSHATVTIPLYYFGQGLFGERFWTAGLVLLAFVAVFLLLRRRYFIPVG